MSQQDKIDQKYDPPFRVDIWNDWFGVTEGRLRELDGEVGVSVARYHVNGAKIERVAPLGLTPEDFLDQWAQLNWNEASKWIEAPSNKALEEWHAKLNALAPDSVDLESAQVCAGKPDDDQTWLLELAVDQQFNPKMKEDTLFVGISKTNRIFRVTAVNPFHPPECQGTTSLKTDEETKLPPWF